MEIDTKSPSEKVISTQIQKAPSRKVQSDGFTRLAGHRRKLKDPWRPKYYNIIESIIPRPTLEHPYPCILIAFRNAGGDTLMRTDTIEKWQRMTWAPEEVVKRFSAKLEEARRIVENMEATSRLLWIAEHLPPETTMIRTDTGETVFVKPKQSTPNADDSLD